MQPVRLLGVGGLLTALLLVASACDPSDLEAPAFPTDLPTETPRPTLTTACIEDLAFGAVLDDLFARIGKPETCGGIIVEEDAVTDPTTIYSESGTAAGLSLPQIDLRGVVTAVLSVESAPRVYAGNDRAQVFVNTSSYPVGDVLIIGGLVAGSIPLDDAEHAYQYSIGLQDGDPANDFMFVPPFDWDFLQGTDFFLELTWDPRSGAWSLQASDVVNNQRQPADVAVVSIIFPIEAVGEAEPRTMFAFFIALDDIEEQYPGREFRAARVTTFATDPDFSFAPEVSGGDVSGEDPTQPLFSLPTMPVRLIPPEGGPTPESPQDTAVPTFAPIATLPPLQAP